MHITEIMKGPILTEKTYKFISEGVYTFKVDVKANKFQVKQAFEKIFEVQVERINLINCQAKDKRVGKFLGKKSKYKKAMIKLKTGQKLDLFDELINDK